MNWRRRLVIAGIAKEPAFGLLVARGFPPELFDDCRRWRALLQQLQPMRHLLYSAAWRSGLRIAGERC